MISAEQATRALHAVKDAGSGKTALELGWIDQVRVDSSRVVFRLSLPGFAQSQRDRIVAEARQSLLDLDGIDDGVTGTAALIDCDLSVLESRKITAEGFAEE